MGSPPPSSSDSYEALRKHVRVDSHVDSVTADFAPLPQRAQKDAEGAHLVRINAKLRLGKTGGPSRIRT